MFAAFVVVSTLTAAANAFSADLDVVRHRRVTTNTARHGAPESWVAFLGACKAAGAAGLLIGIAVRPVGISAATGLVLPFLAALGSHLRVRDWSLGPVLTFLALAVASLVLGPSA